MKTALKRNLKQDYLTGEATLKPFYHYSVQNPDFPQMIAQKQFDPEMRKILVSHLLAQYAGLEEATNVFQNIHLLAKENTFTITTGHQLCLFGGPLFTLYKVLSVVSLTETLNTQYPDFQFVPVFWIHGEDHDFEEVNHFYEDYQTKKTYSGAFDGNVGKHPIESSLESLIPEHFPEPLKAAYKTGKTWTKAYFDFFHELLTIL